MRITINSKVIEANEGDSILQTARKNGIYIPAICYLNGCSPTLACRLCMVEVDGKRVYSCNAKVKDGINVITNSKEIEQERNAIMQTYCINHPLECGVCDKSGECELQNMTTFVKVKEQSYAIKDTHKPHKKWGLIQYDPALCIVCERCVTVCSDKIGESALKTTPRGGDQVPKELKDSMPKDAHAIWSKFQKSLIAPTNGDTLDCSMCGECTSVCPVGALIGAKFQYTSNIWELQRVPASNPHSSDCELIYYDVKPKGISDRKDRIYRVSNDFHFAEIHAAARWGFDFANDNARKNEEKFNEIVSAIKSGEIKNIKFNSLITNEEALILENIAQKYDLALINHEAFIYQRFLNEFNQSSGSDYNADYDSIKNADLIISAGSLLRYDSPNTAYKLTNALKVAKTSAIYFHPLDDKVIKTLSKNILCIDHKPGDEIAIMSFLAQKSGLINLDKYVKTEKKEIKNKKTKTITETIKEIIKDENGNDQELTKEIQKEEIYEEIENIEVNKSIFASILGIDEEKFDQLFTSKNNKVLIIGEDFYSHNDYKILATLAGLLQSSGKFKIMLIPPRTNSLGVSKICTLTDSAKQGKTLGYNEKGDFKFSIHGGDIDSAALTQQEGTFTNIEHRVVPTNAALSHDGYFLNDLACALDIYSKYTIDYTDKLPKKSGYKDIKFDNLTNHYGVDGLNHRGYKLERISIKPYLDIDSLHENIDNFINKTQNEQNLPVIYLANPIEQFYQLTSYTTQLGQIGALHASADFLNQNGLSDGDMAIISNENEKLAIRVKLDSNIKNAYALLGDYDSKIDVMRFFKFGRFANINITKQGADNE